MTDDDDAGERLNEALARALDYDDNAIREFCEHLRAGLAEPVVISTAADMVTAEREMHELMRRLRVRI